MGACLYIQAHINHWRAQISASRYLPVYQLGSSHGVALHTVLFYECSVVLRTSVLGYQAVMPSLVSGKTQSTSRSLERSKRFGLVSGALTGSVFVIIRGEGVEDNWRGVGLFPSPWRSTAFGFVADRDSWQCSKWPAAPCPSPVAAPGCARAAEPVVWKQLVHLSLCKCLGLLPQVWTNRCPHVRPSQSKGHRQAPAVLALGLEKWQQWVLEKAKVRSGMSNGCSQQLLPELVLRHSQSSLPA